MASGNSLSADGRVSPPNLAAQVKSQAQTRAFIIAWFFTVIFYFLEYAVRSSPSVMIAELEAHFNTTALGISAIQSSVR